MKKTFYKYFIPNKENDYRPYFFRGKMTEVLSSIILLLFIFSISQYAFIKEFNLASIISSVLVDLANSDRQESNVSPLIINPLLTQVAQKKADDMAAKSYFAHTSPDGVSPWHWFKSAGYDFVYAGENLAINFSDSGDVEKAWMNSQKHRENILNPNFTEIGIAIAKGFYNGKETIFVVQMFGRPAPVSEFAVILPITEEKLEIITEEDTFLAVKNNNYQESAVQGESQVAVQGISYASLAEELIVSPKKTLLYSYTFMGLIVLLLLNVFIFVKIKIQHPLNIFYALFLFAFMASLLYLNHTHFLPDVLIR